MNKPKVNGFKRTELGLSMDKSMKGSPKPENKREYLSPRAAARFTSNFVSSSHLSSKHLNLSMKKNSKIMGFSTMQLPDRPIEKSTPSILFGCSNKSFTGIPRVTPIKARPKSPCLISNIKKEPPQTPIRSQKQPSFKKPQTPSMSIKERPPEIDPLKCLDELIQQTINGGGYFDIKQDEKSLPKTQEEEYDNTLQEIQVILPPLRKKGNIPSHRHEDVGIWSRQSAVFQSRRLHCSIRF